MGLAWKIKKQLVILQCIKFLTSHKPCQFLEICCIATQLVNLYSLELEILLLVSCLPSLVRCFPGPPSLMSSTSSLAHMQNPGSSSSRIVAAQNDAANGWHSSVQFWLRSSAVRDRKGSADPLPLTGLLPSWQRLTSIQKSRKIPKYMVPRDETAPERLQSFPGPPLKLSSAPGPQKTRQAILAPHF